MSTSTHPTAKRPSRGAEKHASASTLEGIHKHVSRLVQQAAGAGFTETSLPKAKSAFRVRTLKGGERVIEKFEGKDKGWKRQIALRGEEMDDAWIQKWVESRNGFIMPTE